MKKFEELTYRDTDTPRYQRATRFANGIEALLSDFLPRDRECQRRIYDHLFRTAYEGNLEILNVPPEHDALTKLQLEQKMFEVLATVPAYPLVSAASVPVVSLASTPKPPAD